MNTLITHPTKAGASAAVAYTTRRGIFFAARIVFIAAIGVALKAPDNAFGAGLAVILVVVVSLVAGRQLDRAAWSHVPGAFSWRYAARGDRFDEPVKLARPDIFWALACLAAWIVGGSVLVNLNGPGGTAAGAAVALLIGIYFVTVGAVRDFLPGRQGMHWLVRSEVLFAGAAWMGIGLAAEPSLITWWALYLLEVVIVATAALMAFTFFGRRG